MLIKSTHKIRAVLAGSVLLVALAVVLAFWAFRQIENAAVARRHATIVIKQADDLLSALKDAETGMRGYLLTGDETFLEPYLAMRDDIPVLLKELHQLTQVKAAQEHLDVLTPLVDAKLAHIAKTIDLRRNHDPTGASALVSSGEGKRLMDSIRAEMRSFSQIQEDLLTQNEAAFQSDLRRLFAIIVFASLFALLLALAFAYLIQRGAQQRLRNLVQLETEHLLEIQQETTKQLQQVNATLQVSEEKLAVTLHSIGDAVIATDAEGRVTLLNSLAEKLTGWTLAKAINRPVDEIFHIINQETRQPAAVPVKKTLTHGTIQGLANHTVLIALDGSECAIADSCAPIRDRDGHVVGAVLVFRDVTEEYAAQQNVRDGAALVQMILNTVVDGIITVQASDGLNRDESFLQKPFTPSALVHKVREALDHLRAPGGNVRRLGR